jgi:hypothetical protein
MNARITVLSIVRTYLFARNALELGRDVPEECRMSFGFTRAVFWVRRRRWSCARSPR